MLTFYGNQRAAFVCIDAVPALTSSKMWNSRAQLFGDQLDVVRGEAKHQSSRATTPSPTTSSSSTTARFGALGLHVS